jgi:hypothetical protein
VKVTNIQNESRTIQTAHTTNQKTYAQIITNHSITTDTITDLKKEMDSLHVTINTMKAKIQLDKERQEMLEQENRRLLDAQSLVTPQTLFAVVFTAISAAKNKNNSISNVKDIIQVAAATLFPTLDFSDSFKQCDVLLAHTSPTAKVADNLRKHRATK